MRLQKSIFLWIAVSVILPLMIVILALSLYGERLYRQQVAQQMSATLSDISTNLERSMAYERSIIMRIASSSTVRQYLPVLAAARNGEIHSKFDLRTDQLNRFLLSFNTILLEQGVFRVLDLKGNTMVKVGFGRITPPSFDGFESFPYAEHERGSIESVLSGQVADLKDAEVNFLALLDEGLEKPLLEAVVPLRFQGERVGYLVTSLNGLQLDYFLQLAPRPYQGRLSVIENNVDNPGRHSRILYDEQRSILMTQQTNVISAHKSLMNAIQENSDGALLDHLGKTTTYYSETFPYPDRLLSWIIAIQVDDVVIAKPFQQLRWGILILALLILGLNLLMAQFAAGKIAKPLALLIKNFRAMSQGKHTQSLPQQNTQELNELSVAFNEMQHNLGAAQDDRDKAQDMLIQNAKLASIGQLAAGIGHELNNPLNNILSYARLIRREADTDTAAVLRDIDALQDEAERAGKIVQGVLGFSRQVPASFTKFSAQEWLQQSIELVQSMAQEKSVEVRAHVSEDYVMNADRGMLQQALINLLINAIQVSPPSAVVDVYVERQADLHTIRVDDAGSGIDDDSIEHLFEPFFTTKEVGDGSGLGLSITLGIVEQHQGALQLQNRHDSGGEVIGVSATIALPLIIEADQTPL